MPENLAGRVLASRGEIDFNGTPKAYAVKGELDVGPPNELAHVVIDATGTDARADLRTARAAAERRPTGVERDRANSSPWPGSLYAKASDFNPGALLADWPGA